MSRQPGQKSCKNGPFWGASMTTKQFEHVYFLVNNSLFACSRKGGDQSCLDSLSVESPPRFFSALQLGMDWSHGPRDS